jgi:hypothetical protein
MCRVVRPEDKHITRIRGLHEMVIKCGHFWGNTLVLKDLPNIKTMPKKKKNIL